MLKYGAIGLLFVLTTGYAFVDFRPKPAGESPETGIAQSLVAQTDSLAGIAAQFNTALQRNAAQGQLQQLFLQARLRYKKREWAAEYFTPDITRTVNGPPVPEVEPAEKMVFAPAGLQVMEQYLFPKYDGKNRDALVNQIGRLQSGIA